MRSTAIHSLPRLIEARAQSLLALGKPDKAIEDFNAALNVDNRNADAWAGLGLAYEKQGDRARRRPAELPARLVARTQTKPWPARASGRVGG